MQKTSTKLHKKLQHSYVGIEMSSGAKNSNIKKKKNIAEKRKQNKCKFENLKK
jgi:hypothetical protein